MALLWRFFDHILGGGALELLVFVMFVGERELEKVVVCFACRERE